MIPVVGRRETEFNPISVSGVNLLIGTESELMLLDRSGQGKVYQLISRRRFQQMEVLEGQNILITISGKKNRVRVYYLSWLKSKILRTDGVCVRLLVNKIKLVHQKLNFTKKQNTIFFPAIVRPFESRIGIRKNC